MSSPPPARFHRALTPLIHPDTGYVHCPVKIYAPADYDKTNHGQEGGEKRVWAVQGSEELGVDGIYTVEAWKEHPQQLGAFVGVERDIEGAACRLNDHCLVAHTRCRQDQPEDVRERVEAYLEAAPKLATTRSLEAREASRRQRLLREEARAPRVCSACGQNDSICDCHSTPADPTSPRLHRTLTPFIQPDIGYECCPVHLFAPASYEKEKYEDGGRGRVWAISGTTDAAWDGVYTVDQRLERRRVPFGQKYRQGWKKRKVSGGVMAIEARGLESAVSAFNNTCLVSHAHCRERQPQEVRERVVAFLESRAQAREDAMAELYLAERSPEACELVRREEIVWARARARDADVCSACGEDEWGCDCRSVADNINTRPDTLGDDEACCSHCGGPFRVCSEFPCRLAQED
ncbi:hypothetical protein C8R43DRAFT_962105 [Mycena crocata]|nr:hypothetical protein C8R43DRAFT_962105 [Mycena crocata]